LSAHTAIGKINGFTEEETLDLRFNSSSNSKLNSLVILASELAKEKGKPSETAVKNFFEVGYTKAAFAELIAVVSLTTITNTIYHNGGFEIDFPNAKHIEELQEA